MTTLCCDDGGDAGVVSVTTLRYVVPCDSVQGGADRGGVPEEGALEEARYCGFHDNQIKTMT